VDGPRLSWIQMNQKEKDRAEWIARTFWGALFLLLFNFGFNYLLPALSGG
jgi:hypothetical protein